MFFTRLAGTLVIVSVAWQTQAADVERRLNDQLQQVLAAEAEGAEVDRRSVLATTDETSRWHAGILTLADRSLAYEDLAPSPALVEYQKERAREPLTLDRHWQLAQWCLRKGLTEQKLAHLHAVLNLEPNHLRARYALGHVWLGDRWLTPQDIDRIRVRSDRITTGVRQWMPKLEGMVSRLSSGSAKSKQRALKQLDELNDPECLPAIELLIPSAERVVADLLVDKLADFQSAEACLALCRIALNDPGSRPSIRATKALRGYHADHYVPELLSLLVVPATVDSEISRLPNGDLVLQRQVFREVQDRKELHRYTKYIELGQAQIASFRVLYTEALGLQSRLGLIDPHRPGRPNRWDAFIGGGDIGADEVALERALQTEKQALDSQLKTLQRDARKRNAAVIDLLQHTQQVSPGESPNDWWNWWSETNVRLVSRKPLADFDRYEYERNHAVELGGMLVDTTLRTSSSCLVAGTPIQSAQGLVAIESLKVGDLVMSQNVESGELRLRPVLQTTLRPPESTLAIHTDQETIHATAGHPWWVSGKGWLRSKELRTGMKLHTARGNVEIGEISVDAQPVQTYNLVVADDHSYFVGQQRILSYDNTEVRGTLRAVPGYGQVAVKAKH